MKEKLLRNLMTITTFVVLLVFFSGFNQAYALDCTFTGTAPSYEQILCPVAKLVNLAIIFGGVIFAVFIGFGAIKISTSLGDPKGFEGARKTWTFAIIGVFIVFGSLAILRILGNVFGLSLSYGGTGGLFDNITAPFTEFLIQFKIIDSDPSELIPPSGSPPPGPGP